MYEELKHDVCTANVSLVKHNLVVFTWGNVSAINERRTHIVIKPSGVEYEKMKPEDMVVVDVDYGEVVDGQLSPSSDTPTHLEIYRRFPKVSGIVHTHSKWATIFAQMCMDIPPLGTTHADYFYGAIRCTRPLTEKEILNDYELETGKVIAETFGNTLPTEIPAVLVANHGPFTWGKNAGDAVHNAVVLEEIAFMAWHCMYAKSEVRDIQQSLLDKHFLRKHGENAYYGQKS